VIARLLLAGLAAALLSGCAGVLDNCDKGLADGPPGASMRR
jgi:hypothetical protein